MSTRAPWLTVVTVVKDALEGFVHTVNSLDSQKDVSCEFLVIDSSSNANEVRDACASIPHVYQWTEPQGIYAAMNEGIASSSGDYLFFLNAGDTFHSPNTLAQVRGALERSDPQWAFGRVQIIGVDGVATITPDWNYRDHQRALFARGNFPPHQGTFVKRNVLESLGGFDTSYRIAADYAAFLRLSQLSAPELLDLTICDFTEGGASTTQWRKSFIEFHRARRQVFQPSGYLAAREYAYTIWQIATVGLYRGFWSKLVQR